MSLNLEKIEHNPGGRTPHKGKKWRKRQTIKKMRLVPKDEVPHIGNRGWEY